MPNGKPKKQILRKTLEFKDFDSPCPKNAQKKPIKMISFSQFNTICNYWMLYSSSLRYKVAMPISSKRAVSALLPWV